VSGFPALFYKELLRFWKSDPGVDVNNAVHARAKMIRRPVGDCQRIMPAGQHAKYLDWLMLR
jgi:hypothetical protein